MRVVRRLAFVVCYTLLVPLILVNTQIFSYAFRRCNKRILSPSCFLCFPLSSSRSQREGDSIQSIQ
nr:MAG TPA: hypothetical protein [Caudoviricetes sp.]